MANTSKARPRDISGVYPWSSVLRKAEYEIVAQNIMKILSRTGNVFRELSFDEYKLERAKDCKLGNFEKEAFDIVVGYTISAYNARMFCHGWKEVIDGKE